jgi:hypothetical protein
VAEEEGVSGRVTRVSFPSGRATEELRIDFWSEKYVVSMTHRVRHGMQVKCDGILTTMEYLCYWLATHEEPLVEITATTAHFTSAKE